MKVLLLNGSPKKEGCTFTALNEVSEELKRNNIETEIIHIAKGVVNGCIACRKCFEIGKCIFNNDLVNEVSEKLKYADGLIIGSPVYYASINGTLSSFLDRLFYSSGRNFKNKVGASVVSARRAGTTAAFDQLNKYFTISSMPIISSTYWNMVHGFTPDDVKKDLEGLETMRNLGKNMSWILKSIEAGKNNGVKEPEITRTKFTNFID